jgi:hypothetical protein
MKGWWACRRMRANVGSVRRMRVLMMVAFLAGLGGASPGFGADAVETFYKGKKDDAAPDRLRAGRRL